MYSTSTKFSTTNIARVVYQRVAAKYLMLRFESLFNQSHSHRKLSQNHPETRIRRRIENLHRHPRGQQVPRKMACKNAEFREWGCARSTGRNEKPHRARGSAGSSPSQRLVLPMLLAETQGFEPWIQVLPRCALSRGVPSTTRPRLRKRR